MAYVPLLHLCVLKDVVHPAAKQRNEIVMCTEPSDRASLNIAERGEQKRGEGREKGRKRGKRKKAGTFRVG